MVRDTEPDLDVEPDLDIQVFEELKRLRGGAGLQSVRLAERTGPLLGELVSIGRSGDAVIARTDLMRLLDSATAGLPQDVRLDALMGLGAAEGLASTTFQDRLGKVAERIERQEGAARRRVDAAHRHMAKVLAQRLEALRARDEIDVRSGWAVERLSAVLDFTATRPLLTEERTIRVTDPEIRRVTLIYSLEGQDVAVRPEVEALDGCVIEALKVPGGRMVTVDIGLPEPVPAMQSATFRLALSLPGREALAPLYGMAPVRPARHFEAEIRFADSHDVASLCRFDGIPTALARDHRGVLQVGDVLPVDGATVSIAFENLSRGLCYGLSWEWAGA